MGQSWSGGGLPFSDGPPLATHSPLFIPAVPTCPPMQTPANPSSPRSLSFWAADGHASRWYRDGRPRGRDARGP